MTDIIKDAKRLAELKVPPLRAEVTAHEDEDPRYTDDCLVQIIEKDDENSIWYEEEHGGYEHGKLHFAHVFAAAPEFNFDNYPLQEEVSAEINRVNYEVLRLLVKENL